MRPRQPRHPLSPRSAAVARCAVFVCATLLLAATSCVNPKSQTALIQELNDAATEINGMKSDISQLQNDLDSLKQVLAKQDTVISRLVEVTHVPR
jgi:septal ring factor EnvC (AmiA/AmiB activator)